MPRWARVTLQPVSLPCAASLWLTSASVLVPVGEGERVNLLWPLFAPHPHHFPSQHHLLGPLSVSGTPVRA